MGFREPIDIIYDGQCGFCVRSLRIVRGLDVWGLLRFVDGTDRPQVEARFPGLSDADLDGAMYAVADGGRTYRGFFAFRRLLWASPLLWPLLPILYFPGARWLGPRVYGWIARNRRSLGCRSSTCPALPLAGPGLPSREVKQGRVG